jgi:hypothetical protein
MRTPSKQIRLVAATIAQLVTSEKAGKPLKRWLRLKSCQIFAVSTVCRSCVMSHAPQHQADSHEQDPVEGIVGVIPWVLPLAGGVLMFLLAFIAVFMA